MILLRSAGESYMTQNMVNLKSLTCMIRIWSAWSHEEPILWVEMKYNESIIVQQSYELKLKPTTTIRYLKFWDLSVGGFCVPM